MRCRRARKALLELELGWLGSRAVPELDQHLDSCPACSRLAGQERGLTRELLALRGELPFEIDMANGIVNRLRSGEPPVREEVSPAALGWASATVAVLGLVLALTVGRMLPQLLALAGPAFELLIALAGGAATLAGAALIVMEVPLELLWDLILASSRLVNRLAPLQPAGITVIFLGYGFMATIITLFVGRDLRRVRAAQRNTA